MDLGLCPKGGEMVGARSYSLVFPGAASGNKSKRSFNITIKKPDPLLRRYLHKYDVSVCIASNW